jgi:hypothetical protein
VCGRVKWAIARMSRRSWLRGLTECAKAQVRRVCLGFGLCARRDSPHNRSDPQSSSDRPPLTTVRLDAGPSLVAPHLLGRARRRSWFHACGHHEPAAPQQLARGTAKAVLPSGVARCIRLALEHGWIPTRPGSPFALDMSRGFTTSP